MIVNLKNEPNGFDPGDSDQFKYIQTNKKSNGKDLVFVNDYNEQDENTNFDQYSLQNQSKLQNMERGGTFDQMNSILQSPSNQSLFYPNGKSQDSPRSFVSKIPRIKRKNITTQNTSSSPKQKQKMFRSPKPGSHSRSPNSQQDVQTLHQQNHKLKDMVLLVVEKLDGFIIKTLQIRQQKKMINKNGKPPNNEIYIQK